MKWSDVEFIEFIESRRTVIEQTEEKQQSNGMNRKKE